MAPPVSFTKTTLSYPVYAADFDPYNRGYLVVAGGGGEGRSGVPNQITLLDVSSRSTLEVAAELDLTRDEDAVMTLANLASKDGLVTFGGINSSTQEREANKNQHLRAFAVNYPKRKTAQESDVQAEPAKGSISLVGKTSLFKTPKDANAKKDNYQRILRLSPAQKREAGSKRIGAVATGLNPESELVIFNATSAPPTEADIIQRIYPKEGSEVNDLDICEPSEGKFAVAYCTDHQVFVSSIAYDFTTKQATSETAKTDVIPAYTLPFPDVFKPGPRPTIKYLRFLTPNHILLCCNLPQRKGAELLILRKRPAEPGEVILRKKLPSHMKAGGGLDVCALDADRNTGARQIVVAVAGHDISIELYTIDYSGTQTNMLGKFKNYTTLRDVHPLQMTKLAFSHFHSPWPTTKATDTVTTPQTPGPQYLRLASTSLGNTVVVDTLPLRPLSRKPYSRYILSGGRNVLLDTGVPILVIGFALLVTLLMLQSYIDIRADSAGQPSLTIVPQGLRNALAQLRPPLPPGARMPDVDVPSINVDKATDAYASATSAVVSAIPDTQAVKHGVKVSTIRIRDLLAQYAPHRLHTSSHPTDPDPADKAIVVRAGPDPSADSTDPAAGALSTEVHASTAEALAADAHAKRWEQLSAEQRERWKVRLVRARAWAVEEGEMVLKGILFSEYAGFVGEMVGEALMG